MILQFNTCKNIFYWPCFSKIYMYLLMEFRFIQVTSSYILSFWIGWLSGLSSFEKIIKVQSLLPDSVLCGQALINLEILCFTRKKEVHDSCIINFMDPAEWLFEGEVKLDRCGLVYFVDIISLKIIRNIIISFVELLLSFLHVLLPNICSFRV